VSDEYFKLQNWPLDSFMLTPVTQSWAEVLGPAIANMPPWSVINYPPDLMVEGLLCRDPSSRRFAVAVAGVPAGLVVIRTPWLHGPYLQTLGFLPGFQSRGFGRQVLHWMEMEARPYARWIWLCYSSFNPRAGNFYRRNGFETAAVLPDLARDGLEEVLMRKRIV
jgi:ribosomal protein S18 acetylase RimI-like enzyme